MNGSNTIPVVVGVSGHRELHEGDRPALYAAVKKELTALAARCPHTPFVLLSSLAAGADQLCADVAEELGWPLLAALPMEREEYEKGFAPGELAGFARHCARAERVFTVPPTEAVPEDPDRDYFYRQAGVYISAHSHILLALWDGGKPTEGGCGTAETVSFSLRGAYSPARGAALRSGRNEAVIHVFTPRGDRTEKPAGELRFLGSREATEEMLRKTDEFNALAAPLDTSGSILPPDGRDDGVLDCLERLHNAADTLSLRFSALYRRLLMALAAEGTVLTMAFLLYDEAQAIWMILVCGAMLLAATLTLRYARREACHRRYIEYRALAECLRVQAYLRYAGSGVDAAELLSWREQDETAWILAALCALGLGVPPPGEHDIRLCWVEGQLQYHRGAGKKARRSARLSERVVRTTLIVSVTLYVAAVFFELVCGGLVFRPVFAVGNVELFRTLLKIALGSLSAATLFIASYYGKQSLPRSLSDHDKMARFYEKMADQLTMRGQTDELLEVLAREELIENGDWCSYQRDNTPDISF
ncbi:MAG: hypothetical protein IJP64_05765 [Oscillospiraceae bacterium]|nr:hypothetical protein [Oscillospiraceae bacterium]